MVTAGPAGPAGRAAGDRGAAGARPRAAGDTGGMAGLVQAGEVLPGAVERLVATPARAERVLHVRTIPARAGACAAWPAWADDDVVAASRRNGIDQPWTPQLLAAEAAHHGRHVALSTGTASGKSLAYLLPALTAVTAGSRAANGRGATALYLAPTKALAGDQLAAVSALAVPGGRATAYGGGTPVEGRRGGRGSARPGRPQPH